MRVIAFYSLKGGVGKTTCCVNIGVALAQKGRRTLVVDLDSNACASAYLGVYADLEASVGAALLGQCPLAAVTKPIVAGLWLAPGSRDLMTLERSLARRAAERQPAYALVGALSTLDAGAYEFVLLDCPGGQVEMGQMALMAADEIVIPTGMSIVDLYAAVPTLDQIRNAQEFRNDDGRPTLLGFLPNEAGKAGVPAKLRAVLDEYGLPCFTPVRTSALLRTVAMATQLEQRCIVLSRPSCSAAVSYLRVAEEIDLGIAEAQARAAAAVNVEADGSVEEGGGVAEGARLEAAVALPMQGDAPMPEVASAESTAAEQRETEATEVPAGTASTQMTLSDVVELPGAAVVDQLAASKEDEPVVSTGDGAMAESPLAQGEVAAAEVAVEPVPAVAELAASTADASVEPAGAVAGLDTLPANVCVEPAGAVAGVDIPAADETAEPAVATALWPVAVTAEMAAQSANA